MCGIFGIFVQDKRKIPISNIGAALKHLYFLSQERGRDSAGLFLDQGDHQLILKRPGLPEDFIRSADFNQKLDESLESSQNHFLALGQCRLVMSGSALDEGSNQPIAFSRVIGLHNGIFTAIDGKEINQHTEVFARSDSHLFFHSLENKIADTADPDRILAQALSESEGSYNLAAYFPKKNILALTSNSGSLYWAKIKDCLVFASEPQFVSEAIELLLGVQTDLVVEQMRDGNVKAIELSKPLQELHLTFLPLQKPQLRRCTRCILPHTYPMIQFDEKGVCNFCNQHHPQELKGEAALLRILDQHRSKDGSPDCLVGMSGGRDSSYGIYLLKKKYGMNPLVYTFDWGLTTDTSRRNQARICGKLGLEHILRAPDLEERRRHIQKNVYAFLKRPHLGMVPLFMAGDKDFYHYGRLIRKQRKLNLTIHCTGHEVERLHFKTGFCGVDDTQIHNVRLYDFSLLNKLRLAFFYTSQYALNPSYINESFFYSLRSFAYSFLEKDDFLYLYQYIQWDEKLIEETIRRELNWEPDVKYGKNQWRMGDGQTAFTNYIYYKVAGFSEYDNFRANQVRLGLISRDEALKLIEEDNRPKSEVLKNFAELVGLNLEDTLKRIEAIPRLY
jgi:asparagine synthetase B (glutamine-hydrolysing)